MQVPFPMFPGGPLLKEIEEKVFTYLDGEEQSNFSLALHCRTVCKTWKAYVEQIPYFFQKLEMTVYRLNLAEDYIPEVVNALGGARAVMELPTLDISGIESNGRAYIDYICPDHLGEHAVYKGKDNNNRHFFAIAYSVTENDSISRSVSVLFQIQQRTWTICGRGGYQGLHEIKEVAELIKTGSLLVHPWYSEEEYSCKLSSIFPNRLLPKLEERIIHTLNSGSDASNYYDVLRCREVCKAWQNFVESTPLFLQKFNATIYQKQLNEKWHPEIVNVLGGSRAVMELPVLDISELESGIIDIKPEHLGEHSIYKGEDQNEQAFVAFGYHTVSLHPPFLSNHFLVRRIFSDFSYIDLKVFNDLVELAKGHPIRGPFLCIFGGINQGLLRLEQAGKELQEAIKKMG